MTRLFRVRTELTNFPGGPGVSTMYFLDVATAIDSVHTLWDSIKTLMPQDVKINVQPNGDIIEDTTGALVDTFTGQAPTEIQGTSGGTYAAPVGVLLRWTTNTIIDRHRLRGRTFVVPADSALFNTQGQIPGTATAGMQLVMNAFLVEQNASFVVWHRPKFGPKPAGNGDRPVLRVGGHGLVTGSGISTQGVVLTSRRD